MSVNKVFLIGNLGRDPEEKGGVLSFSVATNRPAGKRDGKWVHTTMWHRCVLFQNTPGEIAWDVQKGDQVSVEGWLQQRSWVARGSGEKRYITEVVVERLRLLHRPSRRS